MASGPGEHHAMAGTDMRVVEQQLCAFTAIRRADQTPWPRKPFGDQGRVSEPSVAMIVGHATLDRSNAAAWRGHQPTTSTTQIGGNDR